MGLIIQSIIDYLKEGENLKDLAGEFIEFDILLNMIENNFNHPSYKTLVDTNTLKVYSLKFSNGNEDFEIILRSEEAIGDMIQEAKKLDTEDKIFTVEFSEEVTRHGYGDIAARNKEEAREKAYKMLDNKSLPVYNLTVNNNWTLENISEKNERKYKEEEKKHA